MKRSAATQRRLLGEARRESAKAAHIAAIKRRRFAIPSGSISGSANGSNATNSLNETTADSVERIDHSSSLSKFNNKNNNKVNESQPNRKPRKFLKDSTNDDGGDGDDEPTGPLSSGALGDDDVAVFADAVYEDDDREADLIYDQVETRMQSRRQKQRDHILQEQLKQYRQQNPSIRQQFADLKTGLSRVSENEWADIPDIGDFSVKKHKFERFTPLPDTLLERARQENSIGHHVNIDPSNSNKNPLFPASASSLSLSAHAGTDLAAIGAGRTSVLEHNLDALGEQQRASSSGQSVDQDGYLSSLATQSTGIGSNNIGDVGHGTIDGMLSGNSSGGEIGDVKKMRSLLSCITTTNPKHAPAWIAAARLEERSGKLLQARRKIIEACRRCSRDEEVWLEAVRLHPVEAARKLLTQAIRHVWKSEAIWLKAVDFEDPKDLEKKKRILNKALGILPQSEKLWQTLIQLEPPDSARSLLRKGVQSAPQAASLWLALAKLEEYEQAKSVLADAQGHLPFELSVHVAKAQLEETRYGQECLLIRKVIADAIEMINEKLKNTKQSGRGDRTGEKSNDKIEKEDATIVQHKVTRADWLQQAEIMEKAGYVGTVRGIVSATALIGLLDDKDGTDIKLQRWKQDAKFYEDKKLIEVSRAFWVHLTNEMPTYISSWRLFAEFERRQQDSHPFYEPPSTKDNDKLNDITNLNEAIVTNANHKHHRVGRLLERSVELCPTAEVLWLMLAKEVWKNVSVDDARDILKRAFVVLPKSQAIWLAAAKIEVESSCYQMAREILKDAREQIPSWNVFMKSALLERLARNHADERQLLVQGLEAFPHAEKLWLMLAQWFERHEQSSLTDIYSNGYKDHGDSETNGGIDLKKSAIAMLSNSKAVYLKAVQQCPKCAALWLGFARLEEQTGMISRARAILERGRGACGQKQASKSRSAVDAPTEHDDNSWDGEYNGMDLLWRENVYIELRLQRRQAEADKQNVATHGGMPEFKAGVMAMNVLARGLQKCSKSPWLWALSIALETRKAQKARSVEAVKVCGNNPIVITEVARYLWRSNKTEKAREWFRRAVETHPEYADAWAYLIAFERNVAQKPSSTSVEVGVDIKAKVDKLVDEACCHDLKRGDRWIMVRKKVGNEKLTNKQVILAVSDLLGKTPSFRDISTECSM